MKLEPNQRYDYCRKCCAPEGIRCFNGDWTSQKLDICKDRKIQTFDMNLNNIKNGFYDNIDGPAYSDNIETFYAVDGFYHRVGNKPAFDNYMCQMFFMYGKIHRVGGPAFVRFSGKRVKDCEQWYVNGIEHRIDGPSFIDYETGEKRYTVNGSRCRFLRTFCKKAGMTKEESLLYILKHSGEHK